MTHITTKPALLLLAGQTQQAAELTKKLSQFYSVTEVTDVAHAVEAIRNGHFDAVLSQTVDFLPLERAAVHDQALAILNTIAEGVCVYDEAGTLVWQNLQMHDFPAMITDNIVNHCQQAYQYYQGRLTPDNTVGDRVLPPRKFEVYDPADNRFFVSVITPMLDEDKRLSRLACVVWEETANRRLQQRLNAIDKAGSELVRMEPESFKGMTVEQKIALIQEKIIINARELLHFDHFVVRVLNKNTRELEVLFGVDLPGDEKTQVFANEEDNGITGYVAASGKSYICNDLTSDPHYLPGLESAKCSLTVPLRLHDHIVGTLNVESTRPAAFTDADRQMADIFGRYVAIALNVLNLLVSERYETTGQTVDDMSRQVSEPLSEIITKASMLMEDYIGNDDVRHRLQEIIDKVVHIKTVVKEAQTAPQKGITGIYTAKSQPCDPDDVLCGKHLLIVDDEQSIRETISDVIQKYGCITDTAHDGREAIALIGQRDYDLILSDIKLPNANGYDVFAAARQNKPNRPVILMTGFGYDPNHAIVRSNKEGLSAVLYKPFKVDQLISEIRNAIENPIPKKG